MKIWKTFANVSILSLILLLVSCSKEKQIARHLGKKNGEWNIEQYNSENYENGVLKSSTSAENVGSFIFDSQRVKITLEAPNVPFQKYTSAWSNTKKTLTISSVGFPLVFIIVSESKKEITLLNEVEFEVNGTITKNSTTYLLKKIS